MHADEFADIVSTAIKTALMPLAARIAALEARQALPGRDGRDGLNVKGDPGERGERGPQGEPGPVGERGPEGARGLDGVRGAMGADGLNGRDGTIDLIEPVLAEDLRTVTFRYKATGDPVHGWILRFPVLLDRGVFKAGQTYEAMDGVTWDGAFWIAQGQESATPGAGRTLWRLAVKKGADGKPGAKGADGKDGRPGRDLVHPTRE